MKQDEEDKYSKQCEDLHRKIKKAVGGQDLNVGLNVLVVVIAEIIIDCARKGKHLEATMELTNNLFKTMARLSNSFNDEVADTAVSFDDLKKELDDFMNMTKTTVH